MVVKRIGRGGTYWIDLDEDCDQPQTLLNMVKL